MASLAETLHAARMSLGLVVDDTTRRSALDLLMDAGAQIGHLQVGCCAFNRMPLHAEMLVELAKVQRALTKTQGLGY